MSAVLIAVALVAAPTLAHAEKNAEEDGEVSEAGAFALALGGTGLSLGSLMMAARTDAGDEGGALAIAGTVGLIVAPSLGHFYAGETRRGLLHTGVRLAALGGTLAGVVVTLNDCGFEGEDDCSSTGPVIIGVSMATGLVSAIYSIADAPRAARRHNERAARWRFVPGPIMTPGGGPPGMGLHVGGEF